ncbi:TBC1 domain family member 12-like [Rhopalosiphum maidis]|uniref:TBC1 domain family member 12-like n=1 Tax=Rhopalosiphum maidis TaxID=43146 RepID=UPI000EFFDF4B|nr:TBC1 domain family member 12-like [Rhopalosiphum maidis]
MNDSGSLSPFDNGCLSYYFDDLSISDRETIAEDVSYTIDSDDSSCSRTACSSIFGSGPDELESETAINSSCSGSITKSNECLIDVDTSIDSTCLNLGKTSECYLVTIGKSIQKNNYIGVKTFDRINTRTIDNEDKIAGSTALILNCRPAQIPAKLPKEQLEHERLYEKILQNAKKSESEKAKKHKEYLKQKLKNEERLAHVTQIWTQEIIPNWNQMCRTKRCRDLWWNGLPSSVRGKVWCLAIGNDLLINEELYRSCVSNSLNKFKDSEATMHCLECIHLDITRTFPHLGIFQQGGPYFDVLKRILSAYVCLRPDIGYIQGMCFIAAILLLNMEELEAFICLVNLMESPCLNAFYTVNQRLMTSYFTTYNDLLKHNLNKLNTHFNLIGLTSEMYLVDWIYSVFTKSTNLELASIIWDNFLRDNDQFLFRAALGILRSNESQLMQMDSITCAQYLTKLPESFTSNALLKSTAAIRMSIGKQSFNSLLVCNQAKSTQNSLE